MTRVAVVYALVGMGVIEAADLLFGAFELPYAAFQVVTFFILLGFPVALALAWALEITPEGIRATPDLTPEELASIHSGGHGERPWVHAAVGVVVVAGAAATTILLRRPESAPELDRSRVAVAVFRNGTGEPALDELGEAAGHWITQGLQRTGTVRVTPWEVALQSWRFVEAGADEALVRDPLRAFADETGAGMIVSGAYYRNSDSLRFQAEITDATTGEVVEALDPITGPAEAGMEVVERLRERVLGSLAVSLDESLAPFVARGTAPPTLEACEVFQRGLDLYLGYRWDEATDEFLAAFDSDSTFLTSLVYARTAAGNGSRPALTDSILTMLHERRRALSPVDGYVADAYWAQFNGDKSGQIEAIRKAVELAPGSKWAFNLGALLIYAHRPKEAIEVLTTELEPEKGAMRGWTAYWAVLTDAYHMLGEHDEELRLARQARSYYPERLQAAETEAQALAALGMREEGLDLLKEIASMEPDWVGLPGNVMLRMGRTYAWYGYQDAANEVFSMALHWWEERLAVDSSLMEARVGTAETLYELGRLGEARDGFEALSRDFPDVPQYRTAIGIIAAQAGDRAEGLAVSQWLANLESPTPAGVAFWRAEIAALLGERDEAVTLLRGYFDSQPYAFALISQTPFQSLRDYPPFQELIAPKG